MTDGGNWRTAQRLFLVTCTAAVAFLGSDCSTPPEIEVRNDTGTGVRVAVCVDDAADVDAGETFTAEGDLGHDTIECQIWDGTMSRCVAIPVSADEIPFPLSRAAVLARENGC